jgi:predicted restriction endonuclease
MSSIFDEIRTEEQRIALIETLKKEKNQKISHEPLNNKFVIIAKRKGFSKRNNSFHPTPPNVLMPRVQQKFIFLNMLKKLKLQILYKFCCVCGWDEEKIDLAHVIADRKGGKYILENIVPLCPNHHRTFDRHCMYKNEYDLINSFIIFLKKIDRCSKNNISNKTI